MSSAETLRDFINERLTAAAGEIFSVFQQTIVQYEEEIDRQRKLLRSRWGPQVKCLTTASPQQGAAQEQAPPSPVFKVEQEEAELTQLDFPPEDVCAAQDDQLPPLKQETDPCGLTTSADTSSDHGEAEPDPEELLSDHAHSDHAHPEHLLSDHAHPEHLLSDHAHSDHSPSAADQERLLHADANLILDVEPRPGRRRRRAGSPRPPDRRKRGYKCGFCGKPFKCVSKMLQHHRIHTGEKPYSCQMCDKTFRRQHHLVIHMRTHTGEKPYSCQVCGKTFRRQHHLLGHTKTHQGEKPGHICNTCGRSYAHYVALKKHQLSHSGDDLQT